MKRYIGKSKEETDAVQDEGRSLEDSEESICVSCISDMLHTVFHISEEVFNQPHAFSDSSLDNQKGRDGGVGKGRSRANSRTLRVPIM